MPKRMMYKTAMSPQVLLREVVKLRGVPPDLVPMRDGNSGGHREKPHKVRMVNQGV